MRALAALCLAAGLAILESGQRFAPPGEGAAATPGDCSGIVTLSSSNQYFDSAGGSWSFRVHVADGCTWTAAPEEPWIRLQSASGTGTGEVSYTVDPSGTLPVLGRTARIRIQAGNLPAHRVFQAPASTDPCANGPRVLLPFHEAAFPGEGGTITIDVEDDLGCPWSAGAISPWLHVSPLGNVGNAQFELTADPSPDPEERLGLFHVGGAGLFAHTYTLLAVQGGLPGCAESLQRTSINISSDDQDIPLGITAPSTCAWTIEPNVPWIIPQPRSSSGSANFNLHVLSNSATATRTGSILVGGLRFTIRQAAQGACFWRFAQPDLHVPADGGDIPVSIESNPGCDWRLAATVPWIAATRSGSGTQTRAQRFDPNPGETRATTITLISSAVSGEILEDRLAVSQDGGSTRCFARFLEEQLDAAYEGHTYAVSIAAPGDCAWALETAAPWLHLALPSGEGPGSAQLTVDANDGPGRQGDVRIATEAPDVVLRVAQEPVNGCQYGVPAEVRIPVSEASGQFDVETAPGCPWTVRTEEGRLPLLVYPIYGVGSGSVRVTPIYTPGGLCENDDSLALTVAYQSIDVYAEGCFDPLEEQCPLDFLFTCLLNPGHCLGSGLGEAFVALQRLASVPFALNRFRNVRDQVLVRSPAGRRAIALYEEHGGEITNLFVANAGVREVALDAIASWQGPLEELMEGRGAAAQVSPEMVATMDALLFELERLGSPALRADIAAERDRIDFESWAGLPLTDALARFEQSACPSPETTLCLQDGRFEASVSWRDPRGRTGVGHAVPLSSDTGAFWFFSPANIELVVKALDGRSINGNWWVFNGSLTNVEYTLTLRDTTTGQSKTYTNPLGQMGSLADTSAFPAGGGAPPRPTDPAAPDADALELAGGRFRVEVDWRDARGRSGTGRGVRLSSDSGYFWYFDRNNVELIVKVLDGRELNLKWWVFYGALSNVEYTITVTDTLTGAVKQYVNPQGQLSSAADTSAF